MEIILKVFLPLSLAFIMFSLGVGLTLTDFKRVITQPVAFLIGAIGQVLLLPVIAFILVLIFQLSGALAVGMMILSFCPGGVTTNILSKLSNGDVALSVTLTGVVSLLSIVTVPLLVAMSVGYFMGDEAPEINVSKLAISMFAITAVPVAIGMLVRHFAADFAEKSDLWFTRVAVILFAIIIIGALAANWNVFIENLPVLGPALVALNILMLLLGGAIARMAGLSYKKVKTVAIETGIQNGTLGITVGALMIENAQSLGAFSLPSAVYGIIMYAVTIPFVLWVKNRG